MKLARVAGTVVSTISAPLFDGRTLLLCDLVDPEGEAAGGYLIAVDTVGAGPGEMVLLLDEGNGARQVLGADPNAPVRTLVVGIVDEVTDTLARRRGAAPRFPAKAAAPKVAAPKVAAPKVAAPKVAAKSAPAKSSAAKSTKTARSRRAG